MVCCQGDAGDSWIFSGRIPLIFVFICSPSKQNAIDNCDFYRTPKIQGSELENRVVLHTCEQNKIGLSENVDFILAFYMVHEIRNQEAFSNEIKSLLKPDGRVFIVEPPFHISKTEFEETIKKARDVGLAPAERPKVFLSKAVILEKSISVASSRIQVVEKPLPENSSEK